MILLKKIKTLFNLKNNWCRWCGANWNEVHDERCFGGWSR